MAPRSPATQTRAWHRAALGFAATLAFLVPSLAAAQTITLNPTGIDRKVELRPDSQQKYSINRADCLADDVFTFSADIADFTGLALQVWVGSDCATKTQRETGGSCWLVYDAGPVQTPVSIAVRAQDIVSLHKPGTTPNGPNTGTAEDCDNQTSPAPQNITLSFMFVDTTTNEVAGTGATYETAFDLVGPGAPTEVSAGVGEERLVVDWNQPDAETITGYRLYCVESGAGADGGADGGVCNAGALMPGSTPDESLRCGSVGASSSGTASGLTNGVTYAVAVAGVDVVGNVGTLSEVACGTPAEVDNFYESYRRAGGKGGDGYCSTQNRPSPFGLSIVGVGFFALALRRRRRSNS